MTPEQYIDKWSRIDRTERQAAQEHFIDLCRVLGERTPNEAADPDSYTFEKGVNKIDGTGGFADVWKRGCFGWEYKKDRANLDRAYQQLQLYSVALENPPLLVVSDTRRFRVYTNWTNTVQEKHEFTLEDIAHTETRELLQNVFRHPERLQPKKTREQVTKEAAEAFSTIAKRLRMSGHSSEKVAHFVNRLMFCLFAEDVNLLQDDLFKRMLDTLAKRREEVPQRSRKMLSELFANMRAGGNYGIDYILHFNGGLFDNDEALPLDADLLDVLRTIARLDWSSIDPSIFGTLFERFLDPETKVVGVHYTDPGKIMMIVEPVILRPLRSEWEAAKREIAETMSRSRGRPSKAVLDRAEARLDLFLKRLDDIRILDPACGSGNFLYLSMQALKDVERRAIVEAHQMGLGLRVVHCGPHNVKGIEMNPYAAELARTAIWIGNIQWERRNGFEPRKEPVLEDLEAIKCRDALVTKKEDESYGEAQWPEAEFIIGNPPFLGNKKMIEGLGQYYVQSLRGIYENRISGGVDLVVYWFVKAWDAVRGGRTNRVGLVATNSIRSGASRDMLKKIVEHGWIFDAWEDEEWTVEGAQVRVSIVCFSKNLSEAAHLNGRPVAKIYSNLSAESFDVTAAKQLTENKKTSFVGVIFNGEFEVEPAQAREWLLAPLNVNGRPNSDVLRPTFNGDDFNGERNEKWVIDFGVGLSEAAAAQYELPFQYILSHVKPYRQRLRQDGSFAVRAISERNNWWRHARARPAMRKALGQFSRYIATPMVSSYRTFDFLDRSYLPDQKLVIFARSDWTFFGLLHCKFHESWTVRTCAWIGAGNDITYSNQAVFLTYPFPEGLTPDLTAEDYAEDPRAIAIGIAAQRLDELRNNWLKPKDLVDIVSEVISGYPDRVLPKNEKAAAELKKRTLANLYNQRPQWLADAHRDIDSAVAAAYGWPVDISEEESLARLLELNLSRTVADKGADTEDEADAQE